MENPYREEIDVMKKEIVDTTANILVDLGLEINRSQFATRCQEEARTIDIKVNAIIRSGGDPSDQLRIAYFANCELAQEYSN